MVKAGCRLWDVGFVPPLTIALALALAFALALFFLNLGGMSPFKMRKTKPVPMVGMIIPKDPELWDDKPKN